MIGGWENIQAMVDMMNGFIASLKIDIIV